MEKNNDKGGEMISYLRDEKITWNDFRHHLSGPAISIVVHIIILTLLATMILFEPPEKRDETEMQVEMKIVETTPPPDPPKVTEVIEEPMETMTFTDATSRPEMARTVSEEITPVNAETSEAAFSELDIPVALSVVPNNSALRLPVGGSPFGVATGRGPKRGSGGGDGNSYESVMLQGVFYDIKQSRDRKISAEKITEVMHAFVTGDWKKKLDRKGVLSYPELERFYCSPVRLWNSCIFIPRMPAEEAPAAFHCEKEVKTGGWACIYSGTVIAPFSGKFRFVGDADDVILVRFNKEIVLDYGYTSFTMGLHMTAAHRDAMCGRETSDRAAAKAVSESPAYQDKVTIYRRGSSNGFASGRTIEVQEGHAYPIEILISEIPGGIFHAALFVEQLDDEGNPVNPDPAVLPLFRTTHAVPEQPADGAYPGFDRDGYVWKLVPKNYRPPKKGADDDLTL